ncbi:uncharacterized protein METZ01_LOCUS197849, partial [marine metagenome]
MTVLCVIGARGGSEGLPKSLILFIHLKNVGCIYS